MYNCTIIFLGYMYTCIYIYMHGINEGSVKGAIQTHIYACNSLKYIVINHWYNYKNTTIVQT